MHLWGWRHGPSPCSVSQGPEAPQSPAEVRKLAEEPGTLVSAVEIAVLPPLWKSPDE